MLQPWSVGNGEAVVGKKDARDFQEAGTFVRVAFVQELCVVVNEHVAHAIVVLVYVLWAELIGEQFVFECLAFGFVQPVNSTRVGSQIESFSTCARAGEYQRMGDYKGFDFVNFAGQIFDAHVLDVLLECFRKGFIAHVCTTKAGAAPLFRGDDTEKRG